MGLLSGIDVTDEDCEDLLGDPKVRVKGPGGKKKGNGNGSGSGSESGSGSGSGGEGEMEARSEEGGMGGKKKKKKRSTRTVKKAPWEEPRKKKGAQPKKPGKAETEEEHVRCLDLLVSFGGLAIEETDDTFFLPFFLFRRCFFS